MEWGQEGGAVLGRLERRIGMGLAPRYEQAPPCNRTLGSSGWKGSSPPSYSVTSGVPCLQGLGRRGLGEEMQLHPASCSSPEVPLFPSSWSKHRGVLSLQCAAPVEHRKELGEQPNDGARREPFRTGHPLPPSLPCLSAGSLERVSNRSTSL